MKRLPISHFRWCKSAGRALLALASILILGSNFATGQAANDLPPGKDSIPLARFEDVAEKAGVAGSGKAWGTGCAFVDYNRDGYLDLVVANYVDFDLSTAAKPGERASCVWKGVPVMCGPRGLHSAKNILYQNRGDGTFTDVTIKAHIDRTAGDYGLGVATLDFDDDGWPDIYIACDSAPSILYHNNRDGSFTDVAVSAGV